MDAIDDKTLHDLAQAVMRGVANTGVVTPANMTQAIEVMRAELKALICGEEYAAERQCIVRGTISSRVVIASVIASCVIKLGGRPAALS